jgi:ferritin-like metal-binding protein YciE
MEGLLAEGAETIAEEGAAQLIDAGLAADARRVEHYEIAAYNATMDLADVLGHGIIVRLLEKNLEEEEETDAKLGLLARSELNPDAVMVAVAEDASA